jgi:hypothetical protein
MTHPVAALIDVSPKLNEKLHRIGLHGSRGLVQQRPFVLVRSKGEAAEVRRPYFAEQKAESVQVADACSFYGLGEVLWCWCVAELWMSVDRYDELLVASSHPAGSG